VFTGRLIIPGFDRVFIAPVAAVIIGAMIPLALAAMGVDRHVSLPLAIGAVLWVLLSWGPPLAEWRLTGHHRLIPPRSAAAQYVKP